MIHKHGFTLIEMSIVLVIIGLLIGGVMVGQDLIRAAQIRQTGSLIEKLDTAVNTFRTKYSCLPGDCPNATDFGFASNGNGDGKIYGGNSGATIGAGDGTGNDGEENFQFFQMLITAELIGDTRYCKLNQVPCSASIYSANVGLTIPTGQTNAGGNGQSAIALANLDFANGSPDPNATHVHASHAYSFSSFTGGATPALSPAILSQLDSKFDDGLPTSGSIRPMGIDVYYGYNAVGTSMSQSGLTYWYRYNGGTPYGECINATVTPWTYTTDILTDCSVMWFAQF